METGSIYEDQNHADGKCNAVRDRADGYLHGFLEHYAEQERRRGIPQDHTWNGG